jgi:hypothetical protein
MCGDTSGDVVHPFFVHTSNSVGMHLHAGVGDSPAMLQLHAKHSQRALEQMSEVGKSDDAELKLKCCSAPPPRVSSNGGSGLLALISRSANLRFIPVFGRPPELTEEVQERLAVLSQILYTWPWSLTEVHQL